jgi:hypothetical protein
MKTVLASLLLLATVGAAHAESDTADTTRRLVGSCVAVQSARLDDGSKSVDVISKAVAAGCMPVLRAAMARTGAPQMVLTSTALMRDDTADVFDTETLMEDMAVGAITWLRGPGASHAAELRSGALLTH